MNGSRSLFVLAISLACAASPAAQTQSAHDSTVPDHVLVMPFENVAHDSRIVWLDEAAAVLIADDINALGSAAITREERRQAFDRLQVPAAATLTDATIIRVGQLVGAREVVVGSVELSGDVLTVRARTITLDAGRVRATLVESGPMSDLFAIFERLARRIAGPSTRTSEEIQRELPPLPAFEDYIKGLMAETPATQVNYLNAALKLSPTFDRARLALWEVYTDQGDPARALESVQQVAAGAPLAWRARFLSGLSLLQLRKYEEAFQAFKSVADLKPTGSVLNNLGVVQLRRTTVTPQTGQATYWFSKATQADANDEDYFFNLGYAYWLEHDTQAAIYWLREAVRRNPADGDAHYVLGAALTAGGNANEGGREKELARRLSSTYGQWDRRPAAEQVPRGLERLKSDIELPHAARLESLLAGAGQRDQQELAAFYLDQARRLAEQEHDTEALLDLNRVLYLSPYDADAHLLIGRIQLRAGRIREAIDALKIAAWSRDSAETHVALGQAYLAAKSYDEARAEADRALAVAPDSEDAKRLRQQSDQKP